MRTRFVPCAEFARVHGRPLRVAILKRRSKDDPDTKSLQVQGDAIRRWLDGLPAGSWMCDMRPAAQGGDMYEQIVSAWRGNGQHALLKQILARLREYDVVVVYRMDRFGRNVLAVLTALETMREAGVRLYSVEEGIDTADPNQQFNSGLFALLAQQSSDLTSERIRGNKERAKLNGGWRGGAIVYGYRKAMSTLQDGSQVPVLDANLYKTLEQDPEKVKHLTETVDLIVDHGWSVAAAVRRLNDLGVPSPRGTRKGPDGTAEPLVWTVTGLRRILANPALMGYDVVGQGADRFRLLYVDGRPHRPHPPILTDERWHRLQQCLASPGGKRRPAQEALLAGLVVCGACRGNGDPCGRRMYGPGAITVNNASYACRVTNNLAAQDPQRCRGNAVSARQLERLVELVVRAIGADPRWQAALTECYAQARAAATAAVADAGVELAELTRRMADLRKELERAKSASRRAQIDRDIDDVDTRIAALENARMVPAPVASLDFVARWATMTKTERHAVIADLVDQIEITPARPIAGTRGRGRVFDPSRVHVTLRNVGTLCVTEPVDLSSERHAKCPECGAEFAEPSALGVHRRHKHGVPGASSNHARAAMYECPHPGCDRRTTSAGGLTRHVRVRHEQQESLTCPHGCAKVFGTAADLASHLRQAHGPAADSSPVPCPDCGRVLRGGHGVRVHRGRAHRAPA